MATVKNKPEKSGKYRGAYINRFGKQTWITGTKSKTETRQIAEKLEHEERLTRLGYRDAPGPEHLNGQRNIDDVISEYVAWGKAQGGRRGFGWSPVHAHNAETRIRYWQGHIPLRHLEDVMGCQGNVEEILRDLLEEGPAGKPLSTKTVNEYVGALKAFCQWCKDRKYLKENPVSGIRPLRVDTEPSQRVLTVTELRRLIAAAPPERSMLYLIALITGLRANELRSLSPSDIDWDAADLILHEEWTKSRKAVRQPISRIALPLLHEFIKAETALQTYKQNHARYGGKREYPKQPVLYVPTHCWREIRKDMEAAGIQPETKDGRFNFHALRKMFSTLVVECGGNPKEAQDLTRHEADSLTMKVYVKSRPERLRELAERVAALLLGDSGKKKAHTKHFFDTEGSDDNVTSIYNNELPLAIETKGHSFESHRPLQHHNTRKSLYQ